MTNVPKIKHPGKPLPKRLLRPFLLESAHFIDDHRFVQISPAERTVNLYSIMFFLYVVAVGAAIGTLATSFREPASVVVGVLALAGALAMQYYVPRIKPTKFMVFNREAGTIRLPNGSFTSKETEAPWEEWGARLWVMSSSTGVPSHVLSLVHLPTYRLWFLDMDINGVDRLLGLWSAVVQYMDKEGPLPDVPPLSDYPNRTKGLGTWRDWEKQRTKPGARDPYREWLAELKANPELDVFSADVEKARGW